MRPYRNKPTGRISTQRFWGRILLVLGILALVGAMYSQFRDPHPGMETEDNRPYVEQAVKDGFRAMHARVVRVADGDTVYIKGEDGVEQRVRLLGIDAPESKQAFGPQSEQNLKRNLKAAGYHVQVIYKGYDQYGRIVGKLIADGKDLNLEQIKSGNAWFYRSFRKDLEPGDAAKYDSAEREAREMRKGLWSQPNPQNPREWRKEHPRN